MDDPDHPTQAPLEEDFRNAALLVDERRREFLASLDPLVVNSYAVLYARAEKWISYASRGYQADMKRAEPHPKESPERVLAEANAQRWLRLKERWQLSVKWLDRNLTMSGSIRGKRAEQLVDVLAGSRETPGVGGQAVVYPVYPQPSGPPAKKSGLFSR